jgi:hypothetical protein
MIFNLDPSTTQSAAEVIDVVIVAVDELRPEGKQASGICKVGRIPLQRDLRNGRPSIESSYPNEKK